MLSSKPVEFFRGGDALLDRDNVGLILLLQPTGDPPGDPPGDPSSCVCVANTHLLYNPHRGDVKLAQLAILLAEIGRVSRLPDGSSRPRRLQSPIWSPKLGISRRCRYESKRPKFTPAGPPPAVSDPTLVWLKVIGLFSSRWKEFRWSIEHGLSLRQLELEEVNSLPNQHHSSDHLPLLVRFRLRP
uniref:(Atlantic silverside) hypothetical protein n=1 Tax=Menidia menidia TaxID=238744 RepID=A0A8S4AKL1_9TELE|nr:unnamed protein product [Menidia menidia]